MGPAETAAGTPCPTAAGGAHGGRRTGEQSPKLAAMTRTGADDAGVGLLGWMPTAGAARRGGWGQNGEDGDAEHTASSSAGFGMAGSSGGKGGGDGDRGRRQQGTEDGGMVTVAWDARGAPGASSPSSAGAAAPGRARVRARLNHAEPQVLTKLRPRRRRGQSHHASPRPQQGSLRQRGYGARPSGAPGLRSWEPKELE